MARDSVKSPIPRPPNPLSRLFSQPSDFFTDYSSRPTFVPTVEVSDRRRGAVYCPKERWVESSRGLFCRPVTIGRLPDDVLLETFDFYVDECPRTSYQYGYDGWHTLVHVCRRWRNVVFASPLRLHLRLLCMPNRSVKKMLDIWPQLPIIISNMGWYYHPKTAENMENVISALELKDRVSNINFRNFSSSDLKIFAPVMQEPFPALTYLGIWLNDEMAPVISDSFLGGSAPQLRHLNLNRIPFPALPKLLLSATDLVALGLWNIPHSGYISPEAMVTGLSAVTRLEQLNIQFRSPRSRPAKGGWRPPPLTRTVLPALTHLNFIGVTEYLEDLVSRIDTPLLVDCWIIFFNQLLFDLLQLTKFLCRTATFSLLDHAHVAFDESLTRVDFSSRTESFNQMSLSLIISCRELDWQLSSLSQVCNSALLSLSTVQYLDIDLNISDAYPLLIEDDVEDIQWLELLHPFANVKDLRLSGKVPTCIAPALQELAGERVTEVLPVLQNIFLDRVYGEYEPVPNAIEEFVAARHLSGCPVAIHRRH